MVITPLCVIAAVTADDKDDGIDCTFRSTLCGWTQHSNDDFDWSTERENTPTSYTGNRLT